MHPSRFDHGRMQRHGVNHLHPTQAPDRITGILLAVFLGWIGIHKFYIGDDAKGVLSILFFWSGIPLLIGLFDALYFARLNEVQFEERYTRRRSGGQVAAPGPIALPRTGPLPEVAASDLPMYLIATLTEAQADQFRLLMLHFEALLQMEHCWVVRTQGDRLTHRLAAQLLQDELPLGHVQLPSFTVQAEEMGLMFTPHQLVYKPGQVLLLADYRDVQVRMNLIRFDEDPARWLPSPPREATLVKQRWRYALPDGSPDPLHEGQNVQIPTVEYLQMEVMARNQLLLRVWGTHASKMQAAGRALEAYSQFRVGKGAGIAHSHFH